MIKRLSISVMLLAMAAFALTGAATAFWSTSESATVAISAGEQDLQVLVQQNCDGPFTDVAQAQDAGFLEELAWAGIYPGSTTGDCFRVMNTGFVPLEVELRFEPGPGVSTFAFENDALLSALEFRYRDILTNSTVGTNGTAPNSSDWTDGKFIAMLEGNGDQADFRINAQFQSDGTDQNSLQGGSAAFTAVIEAITQ